MQHRTKLTIAAASGLGLASLLAGLAFAAPEGGMGSMMGRYNHHGAMRHMQEVENFATRYDANKDGKISQTEINQNREQWLTDADANKDSKVDLQEFQSLWVRAHRERMVRAFQKLDRDGDGLVTQEEYTKPMNEIVGLLDQNGDGVLSREDLKAMRDSFMGRGRHPMMEDGRRGRMMEDGSRMMDGGRQGKMMMQDDYAEGYDDSADQAP
jgi:Ca2+-binding EF-hand superfamily protein